MGAHAAIPLHVIVVLGGDEWVMGQLEDASNVSVVRVERPVPERTRLSDRGKL